MYVIVCIALFCVALFSKEPISNDVIFMTSGLFAIAGGLAYIGLQFKKDK